jgi:hypothetical protein
MAPYNDPENDSPGSLKSLYQDKLEKRVQEVFHVGLRPKTSMTRQEFKQKYEIDEEKVKI